MGICSLNYNHNKASLLVSNLFSFKCISAMKQPSKAQKNKITFSNPNFLIKNMTTFGQTYKENCLHDYCEFFRIL